MFLAMNNFKVVAGREADFERIWKERKSYLETVPGFVEFALLKSDTEGEYASHTVWENRAAFDAWTKSEAFAAGHRGASMAGILEGHPFVKLYDSVIVERGGVRVQG